MDGPVITPTNGRNSTGLLLFLGGILTTIALVVAIVLLWPSGDGGDRGVAVGGGTDTTSADGGLGEPSERTTTTGSAEEPPDTVPVDLFASGATDVLAQLRSAAGDPSQGIEIDIYDTYAFLAYRDASHPDNLDRRMWRDGEVSAAGPNPIDDRVNADTEPKLFLLDNIDLSGLPGLTSDAPSHFDLDVEVTHVIIDRFLPFDQRVLIRVYASPTDGRSGGGYVQYTVHGTYVAVIQ